MPQNTPAQQFLLNLADSLDNSPYEASKTLHSLTMPGTVPSNEVAAEIRRLVTLDDDTEAVNPDRALIHFTLEAARDDDAPEVTPEDVDAIIDILGPGPYAGQASDQEIAESITDAAQRVMGPRF